VRVTVNTDNRLITDTTASRELWLCHSQMGLEPRDIARIILSGFKSAFLPFHIKQAYLRRVASELERFVAQPESLLAEPETAVATPKSAGPASSAPRARH